MIAVLLPKTDAEPRRGGGPGPRKSEHFPAAQVAQLPGDRLRELIQGNFRSVWRALRRFGVSPSALDDAAQQVFMAAAAKLDRVEPGRERAFLLGTAFRIAANARRRQARQSELADDPTAAAHPDPNPEELLELKRKRALLDEALETLSDDHRAVFVLFELEGCSMQEISQALDIPMGTVASRLRRARARFDSTVRNLRERSEGAGG